MIELAKPDIKCFRKTGVPAGSHRGAASLSTCSRMRGLRASFGEHVHLAAEGVPELKPKSRLVEHRTVCGLIHEKIISAPFVRVAARRRSKHPNSAHAVLGRNL